MNLNIGSGDCGSLLARKNTKTYQNLWAKFIGEKPYYNALGSPIDALRTGAILEDVYFSICPENCYVQVNVRCKEMDVFSASLDFAFIEKGQIADFEELKTIYFPDFVELVEPLRGLPYDEYIPVIKKKFKKYYNQVQFQMMCSGLNKCTLVFIPVYSYDDSENLTRQIKPEEVAKFDIIRDEKVISQIVERGQIFQLVKDDLK